MATSLSQSVPHVNLSSRKYFCYACGVVQLVVVVYVYAVLQSSTQLFTVSRTASSQDKPAFSYTSSQDKPLIVMGILTSGVKRDLRDAQRNTWLNTAMQSDNPFRVKYMFLIDRPTNETIEENKIYKDILYLNATFSGRAKGFGEKLYKWWKYVHENYPDALLAARVDDDAFLCVPQVFHRLYELRSSKLYYGWAHGSGDKIGVIRRVDEMFVVIGRDMIKRIAKRRYCYDNRKCDYATDLIDLNAGGTSMGVWLSIYSDIKFHPDNKRIVHFGRGGEKKHLHLVRSGFCDDWLIFHKCSPEQMKQLHDYNKD